MRKTILLIALVSAGGCSEPTGPRVVANPDVSVKVPAMKAAVREHDRAELGAMVDELSSEDPAVRFYAIEGLRRATNQTLGYRYYDDEAARKEATARWKRWLQEKKQ